MANAAIAAVARTASPQAKANVRWPDHIRRVTTAPAPMTMPRPANETSAAPSNVSIGGAQSAKAAQGKRATQAPPGSTWMSTVPA